MPVPFDHQMKEEKQGGKTTRTCDGLDEVNQPRLPLDLNRRQDDVARVVCAGRQDQSPQTQWRAFGSLPHCWLRHRAGGQFARQSAIEKRPAQTGVVEKPSQTHKGRHRLPGRARQPPGLPDLALMGCIHVSGTNFPVSNAPRTPPQSGEGVPAA